MKKLLCILLFLLLTSLVYADWYYSSPTVVSDGSVGQSSTAEASADVYSANAYWDDFTASAGNVRYGHASVYDSNSATICLILWDSSGNVAANCTISPPDGTPGHYYCDNGSAVGVTATTYLVGMHADGDVTMDQGTDSDTYRYEANSYSCAHSVTPPGSDRGASYNNTSLSIIWTNSTDNPF